MLPTTPLPMLDHLMGFGVAGFMGFMWLFERRESAKRNNQLDEAHLKLMAERQQLEALMSLIRQNTEALARLDTFLRMSIKTKSSQGEA